MLSQVIRQRTRLPDIGKWAAVKSDSTYAGRGGGRRVSQIVAVFEAAAVHDGPFIWAYETKKKKMFCH